MLGRWHQAPNASSVFRQEVGLNRLKCMSQAFASPFIISLTGFSRPNSEVLPMSTEPAATASSSSGSSTPPHQIVGAVVGSVVGILLLAIPLSWYLLRRDRNKRRKANKRQWANMVPSKWVSSEPVERKGEELPKYEGRNLHDGGELKVEEMKLEELNLGFKKGGNTL